METDLVLSCLLFIPLLEVQHSFLFMGFTFPECFCLSLNLAMLKLTGW